MAETNGEAALKALLQLIETIAWTEAPSPAVKRNAPETQEIPPGGLITLRDGDRGDPDVLLSPLRYEFAHRAELVVQVQLVDQAERDALFDSRLRDIALALAANPSLGSAVDYAHLEAPDSTDEAADGAASIKSALIPVILEYVADTPLG